MQQTTDRDKNEPLEAIIMQLQHETMLKSENAENTFIHSHLLAYNKGWHICM